jgi:NTP pyrophosphatase (non-canonical NTP hydrolase)
MNKYQEQTRLTAKYPKEKGLEYCTLGLVGEAGEIANKVKKVIRDNRPVDDAFKADLKAEIGDVLWYVARLADDLGISLQEVADYNMEKLLSRLERGVIGGSGDNR